jgi:hypothetical protein
LTSLGRLESPEQLVEAWRVRPTKLASAFDLAGASIRVDGEPWRIVSVLGPCQGPNFRGFPDFVLLSPAGELVLWMGSETPFVQPDGSRLDLRQGYLGVTVKGDMYFSSFDVTLDDGRSGTLGHPADVLSQEDPYCPDTPEVRRAEGTMALNCRQTEDCRNAGGNCQEVQESHGVVHCRCVS